MGPLFLVLKPFILIPTIGLLLAALFTGRLWHFLVPILGWPIVFLLPYVIPPEPSDFAPTALLVEVMAGVTAVAVGLGLRRVIVGTAHSP